MLSAVALNAQTRDFSFSNSAPNEGFSVEQNTRSGLQMRHALKELHLVTVTDNGYTGEAIQGASGIFLPANAGEPDLPATSRFVAIPNGATAHIEMGYRSMTTLRDVEVMPAAPIKFDTDDSPNTYEKDQHVYGKNAFFPESPVTVSEPFNLRGVQTVAITVVPYQYNPVTKELRVYDDMQFSLRFDGGDGEFGETRLRSPYWDPILMQNLVNYNQLPVIDYEARMQEWANTRPNGCEYLIVIPNNEAFRPYADQLKEYRIKQGIITDVKSLSDMECTTTDQMKAYFHNAYNTWTIPPVAVLLLGDHNANMGVGIPAEYTYHSSSYGNCITDNGYADVNGDNLPEMAFSRLVAANPTEAQMMVSKQLEYEYTNPNLNPSTYDQPITALGWQTERWFQICSEVVGGYWRDHGKNPVRINAIYQGSPGTIWSSNQNTYMVVNYFGPNGLDYIPATPAELGGWTGGTASQVVQAVNNGCMLLQHRDHGYYQGWGEPSFSTSNVSQMNNVGKMTFVNTINCQTGTFDHTPECLIEAFMRRTSGGQNAGAVGCIGPTQTSYSFVNDAYAWGLYDQYDPQFMPDYGPYANYEGNWRPAFGNVAGKYFLQQSSWPYNAQNKAITYKMFTAHCDAFLTLYTEVPTAMNVSHPSQITATTTSVTVSAPAGAIIALTRGDNILAVATATGNNQNISFAAQPSNSDICIVATKQDRLRYVGNIHVISEPHLTIAEMSLNDENGNQALENGENATFNMTIKNIGDLAASAASAVLSTSTPDYVTINSNSANIPALGPNQTTELTDVFSIHVADDVPNDARIDFTLTMTGGNYTWTSDFHYIANAPFLKVNDIFTVHDEGSDRGNGNGRLDPGETAEVVFSYSNKGRVTANEVAATLTTATSQYISIASPTVITADVEPEQTIEVAYVVSISATMPRGEEAVFTLQAVTGPYVGQATLSQRVGLELANFENGMGDFDWNNDGSHPWTVVNTEPYSGSHCLQSGDISHNQTSTLSIDFDVEYETDEIRFFRRLDCADGDYLKFYIDGEEKQGWSGTLSWREAVYPVTQGEHTFTWTYEKNASGTAGADHVWLDNILFPVRHISFACNAGVDQNICQEPAQLEALAIGYTTLAWTSDGDGSFSQTDILDPIYTPGEQDLANKIVTMTLTATNENGEILSDEVTIYFHSAAIIEMDDEASICEGQDYSLQAIVSEADSYIWETDGDGSFDRPDYLSAVYTPGTQDIANGQVTLTLTAFSPFGCGDASHSLLLTIHPLENTEFEAISCGSYIWNGLEYSEEGDYTQVLQSIFGCDSTVVMHLTMVDAYHVEVEENACDEFEWNGMIYTESGVYENIFSSIHGCDSIVTMHLTMSYSVVNTITASGCDSYEWEGTTYTESGEYLLGTYQTIHGCDSICMLSLTLGYTPTSELIEGTEDLDVAYTPNSVYTIVENLPGLIYNWTVEPENAGTVEAENTTATVIWNESFKGEALVKVNASNECGEAISTLLVTVRNTIGVDEHGVIAKLYPNPTSGMVTIEAEGMRRLTVSNALGQVVYDAELRGDTKQLNMASFEAGLYLIRIHTDSGIAVRRLSIVR